MEDLKKRLRILSVKVKVTSASVSASEVEPPDYHRAVYCVLLSYKIQSTNTMNFLGTLSMGLEDFVINYGDRNNSRFLLSNI